MFPCQGLPRLGSIEQQIEHQATTDDGFVLGHINTWQRRCRFKWGYLREFNIVIVIIIIIFVTSNNSIWNLCLYSIYRYSNKNFIKAFTDFNLTKDSDAILHSWGWPNRLPHTKEHLSVQTFLRQVLVVILIRLRACQGLLGARIKQRTATAAATVGNSLILRIFLVATEKQFRRSKLNYSIRGCAPHRSENNLNVRSMVVDGRLQPGWQQLE